jgi:hypothetical protein
MLVVSILSVQYKKYFSAFFIYRLFNSILNYVVLCMYIYMMLGVLKAKSI